MSKHRKLQSITLLISLVASVFVGAFPAYAAVSGATVSLENVEVLAGEAAPPLEFTVTNTGSVPTDLEELQGETADASITWVRIRPEVFGLFTPVNAAGGEWVPHFQDLNRDGFTDAVDFTGGSIAPQQSETFTIVANVASIPADRSANWSVRVSDDPEGTTSQSAVGTPSTMIRVLNVVSAATSAPVGVLDGSATAGQDNLAVESVVKNHASVPLVVDPSLASSNGSSDTITDQGPVEIASGATETFTFPLALGSSTSSRVFTGDATATGAEAVSADSPALTVQAPAAFDYAGNTLQPRAAGSGAEKTFQLSVVKSNPPSVDFDLATSELTFTNTLDSSKTFSTGLASPALVGTGGGTQVLTFDAITIPGTASLNDFDGVYTPSLVLNGTDGNGADVVRTVGIGDNFEIDNLVPHVEPVITAPNGQIDSSNVQTAKSGQTLSFSGPIKTSSAPGSPGDPAAAIVECWLVLKDLGGIELSRSAATCSNSNGNLSGSAPVATELESARAVVEVVVADAAGNTTLPVQSASFVLIDNLAPQISGARTGCGPTAAMGCINSKTIRVNLSEPVLGGFDAFDFTVDGTGPAGTGDIVTAAAEANCVSPVATKTFCSQVVLTLLNGNADEDWETTVTYDFKAIPPTKTSPADGATGALPTDAVVDAVDGIVPALPTLATVTQDGIDAGGQPVSNARGAQDGAYYTNQEAPTFGIGGVKTGYTGIVAINDNGIADYQNEPTVNGATTTPADTVLASCIAEGTAVDCTPESNIGGDGTYDLLVTAMDGDGNLAEASGTGAHALPVSLIIDNVVPAATAFATSGLSSLDVSFNEALGFGRDAAADWIAVEVTNGEEEGFDIGSVGGTDANRSLTVDDSSYTAGDADRIYFTFVGAADRRYQDRAGNYLGDLTLNAP